jgi:hypothetical protein
MLINECYFSSSDDERLRSGAAAAVCVLNGVKLRMRYTEFNECNEAGLLAENASIDVAHCKFRNSRQPMGSAVEIRNGADGVLDSCSIENYAKGILAWRRQSNLKMTNCSVINCRSEGILVSFEPLEQFWPPTATPIKQLTSIIGCKIVGNAAFGITIDDKSNAIISKCEIAFNGSSGCIVKGGVTCTVVDNYIHSNKQDGIHVGYNLAGMIMVRNNRLKGNGDEAINNFYEKMSAKDVLKFSKVPECQIGASVYKKPSIENNILERDAAETNAFKVTRFVFNIK